MSTSEDLKQTHAMGARTLGAINMAIVKRRITISAIEQWIENLRTVVACLEQLRNKLSDQKRGD